MAKIPAGILGRLSGSVGNVTGASWKGIAYIREKVVPSNPQTVAQTAQRVYFALIQAALKPHLASAIRPYMGAIFARMSAFNAATKLALDTMGGLFNSCNLTISAGPLDRPEIISAVYDPVSVFVSWNDASPLDASGSNVIRAFVLDRLTGAVLGVGTPMTREEAGVVIQLPGVYTQLTAVVLAYAERLGGTAEATASATTFSGTAGDDVHRMSGDTRNKYHTRPA